MPALSSKTTTNKGAAAFYCITISCGPYKGEPYNFIGEDWFISHTTQSVKIAE